MHLFIFLLLSFYNAPVIAHYWQEEECTQLAIAKEPVVDLFLKPSNQTHHAAHAGNCTRAHQLIANEIVLCTQEQDGFSQIICSNILYGIDAKTHEPLRKFWVNSKHLLRLHEITKQNLQNIPTPASSKNSPTTLILTYPFQQFSFGTRFVCAPAHNTKKTYGAHYFDPVRKKSRILHISHENAHIEKQLTLAESRTLFVTLANNLVDRVRVLPQNQVIPYVWGGSSFVSTYTDNKATLNKKNGWMRPEPHTPYTGFDCSELVLRLAQASGLPHPFKTSHILETYAHALEPQDTLEAGDLIWMPGHVVIISNLQQNELIEARGYDSGYGRIHRLKLKKCFKDITNYQELQDAYFAKKKLTRLKKDGTVENTFAEFKLLKLYPT